MLAIGDNFQWHILKKISCYGENLTFWTPTPGICHNLNLLCGFRQILSHNKTNNFLDVTKYKLDVAKDKSGARRFLTKYNSTVFEVTLPEFNKQDIYLKYTMDVGFERSSHNLTYAYAFGVMNGKPCDKFDKNNCTLCNSIIKDPGNIKDQENIEDQENIGAYVAGASVITAGIIYGAMLFKYRSYVRDKT